MADRLLRSGDAADHLGDRQSGIRMYDPQARPGDNLYTNSVVALDIDTGKLAWYFQYTPNNSWDYDEIGIHMLYDATINGQARKVVGHFGRNGFFYTLDRANGSFIKSGQYVNDLNWTKGLDPEDRQAARIRSEARRADLHAGGARAARRRHEARVPDLARRRRPPADRLQSGQAHRLRGRRRGLLLAERRQGGVQVARRRHRPCRRARSAPSPATSTTAR